MTWSLLALLHSLAATSRLPAQAVALPACDHPTVDTLGWKDVAALDGKVHLRVPTGFWRNAAYDNWASVDSTTWVWVSFSVGRTEGHLVGRDRQPTPDDAVPHLYSGSTCAFDCTRADSLSTCEATIEGHRGEVEWARLSGGYGGSHKDPAVLIRWSLGDGRWLVVHGTSIRRDARAVIYTIARSATFVESAFAP